MTAAEPGAGAPDSQAEAEPSENPSDLRGRLVPALVMMAIAIGLALLGGPLLGAFAAVAVGLMALEWLTATRLTETARPSHMGLVLVLGAGLSVFLIGVGLDRIGFFGALALSLAALATFGRKGLWAFGLVFYLALPMQGLVWLRGEEGTGFLLWLLSVVWAADSGAMLAGRGIGGPAFAPRVSPNKTWSGMLGGLMGGLIVGLLAGDLFGVHPPWAGPWPALLIATAALAGDLAQSALKRVWGLKNTGELIPGHGGVFDRLDSLLGASAVAVGLALLHPAL